MKRKGQGGLNDCERVEITVLLKQSKPQSMQSIDPQYKVYAIFFFPNANLGGIRT